MNKKKILILGIIILLALAYLLIPSNGDVDYDPQEDPIEYEEETDIEEDGPGFEVSDYSFRNAKLLAQHFEKHGIDMGFEDEESYTYAANLVISNPESLHKTEKEDGDDIYYLEESNEFVVLSRDGYIRTYFLPDAGKKYYDKQ